jgi:hypothetical protein
MHNLEECLRTVVYGEVGRLIINYNYDRELDPRFKQHDNGIRFMLSDGYEELHGFAFFLVSCLGIHTM